MTFFLFGTARGIFIGENGHIPEVVTLMEREWSSYRGTLMNDHLTEVVTLMEGERSCYRDGQ